MSVVRLIYTISWRKERKWTISPRRGRPGFREDIWNG